MGQLEKVHQHYNELMYNEDQGKTLDLLLAVHLSRLQTHSKLWLIYIAESGFGKSELLKPFDDSSITTMFKRTLTPATLISKRKNANDLAPKLNNKVLVIEEMAQILSLPTETKKQLFSQLIDLYDGVAITDGSGIEKSYTNLNVSFIGCSTPAIEQQFLLFQELGTRFFTYHSEINDIKKLMEKIKEHNNNPKLKEKRRALLKQSVQEFLTQKQYKHLELSDDVVLEIERWSNVLACLRSSSQSSSSNGELTSIPSGELPTRINEQMQVLYTALMSLDKDYSSDKAFGIVKKVLLSSIPRLRLKVLLETIKLYYGQGQETFSRKELAEYLKMGSTQVSRELNMLTYLDIMKTKTTRLGTNSNTGEEILCHRWYVNIENEIVATLTKYVKEKEGFMHDKTQHLYSSKRDK